MADRSVIVRLKAQITDFQAGMRAAGQSVDEVQRKLADGDAKTKRNLEQVSRGMMLVGVAGVAAAGAAVTAFAGFDKEMSNVKAVSGAAAGQMDRLREAALQAGADTVFSASEAAKAEAELARAGVSTADILGGALRGSLDLAASGQLELADAATIAAQAMNIFKLQGSDVSHIADVLSAGANKSAADVKSLGDALKQGGLVAAQTGVDLEETVGTLSAFADSALVGSDAGTSFKTMLQRLLPQSKEAGDAMESIGFNAFDAQGNFVGLAEVAGQLQQALGTMTAEQRAATMNTIFGADAVRAANVLYEQGEAGIRNYTEAVNDQGAATRNAATQLDNLAGDVEALKGSLETALIQSGSSANGVLRTLTQTATGFVNSFAGAPSAVQGTVTAVAGLGGAALLTVGAIGTFAPKVAETKRALEGMGRAGEMASAGMGKLGRGLAIATAGFIAYEAATAFLSESSSDLARFTQEIEATASSATTASKIRVLTEEMNRLKEESNEGWLNGEIFGYGVRLETGAYKAGQKVFALEDRIKQLRHEQKLQSLASDEAADSTETLGGAMEGASDAADAAADALVEYKDALDAFNGVNIDAARAQLQLADAYTDANEAKEKGTKVTNDEVSALLDFAEQANQTAKAIGDQTGSQDKMSKSLRTSRERFLVLADAMGIGETKAERLRDKWLQIPTKRETKYSTSGIDGAVSDVEALRRKLLSLPSSVTIPVRIGTANKLGTIPLDGRRASGGPVNSGGLYLVGEQGPELFRATAPGSIVPAAETRSMLSAAPYGGGFGSSTTTVSGDTYETHITETRSARQTAREVLTAQRRARFEKAGAW